MTIKDSIRLLAANNEVAYCLPGKVTSVDKTNNVCDVEPLDDSAEIVEVRLQAETGTGFISYPVIGSTVIVSFLNKDQGYISMFSQIELYDIQTENESLKAILVDILGAIKTITVTTSTGPSGTPINAAQFTSIENRLNKLLK